MENLLHYINNTEDADANFALGQEYESLGQAGAAISFYLRTAERSLTDIMQYEALLRCALCFERQQTRERTEKVLLQKAISLLPKRPEAYFLLSRLHEVNKQWQDAYTIACIGLSACDFDSEPLKTDVEYPGMYVLLFQKGVASWWVGLCEEAREIMFNLKYNYTMTELFSNAVDRNIANIGWPNTVSAYDSSMLSRSQIQFDGLETITKNYAQTLQDIFVLSATNGKRKGRYLEIGCAEPFKNNNTALLETQFEWTGISIDINSVVVKEFMAERKNLVFGLDATKIDYSKFLNDLGYIEDFDYLQIDCDPPKYSLEILKRIPFEKYRFATITFEHDYYTDKSIRDQSRLYLQSKGYILAAGDIAFNKIYSYEDWWIHPKLISIDIQKKLINSLTTIKCPCDYLFPQF